MLTLAVATLCVVLAYGQTAVSAKVFRHSASGRYYGKMYIPQGGKYYVDFHPSNGVTTGVYAAYIDGENIYLQSAGLIEGRYMIDATERDMMFIVRSNTADDVVATPVPAALSEWMDANGYYYYDATDARRNALKYATAAVSNAKLLADYPKKRVYVMANPANNDLAFAVLDHQSSSRSLPANSLYLVSRKSYSARLNIVWLDEPDMDKQQATAISTVTSVAAPADDAIYSILGTRISDPKPGTLYIRNGRKYIAE